MPARLGLGRSTQTQWPLGGHTNLRYRRSLISRRPHLFLTASSIHHQVLRKGEVLSYISLIFSTYMINCFIHFLIQIFFDFPTFFMYKFFDRWLRTKILCLDILFNQFCISKRLLACYLKLSMPISYIILQHSHS